MKIAILHQDPDMQELLTQLLCSVPETRNARVDAPNTRDLDHKHLINIVKADYTAILLPLRLPFYASLRLAEIVHLTKSPSRLVLVSGTPLRKELLLQLFDRAVLGPFSAKDLRTAVWKGPAPKRHGLVSRREYTEAAIAELLQQGSYMVLGASGLCGTLEHYRNTFYPYYPFEPLAAPGRARTSLDQCNVVTPVNFRMRLERARQRLGGMTPLTPNWATQLDRGLRDLQWLFRAAVNEQPRDAETLLRNVENLTHIRRHGRLDWHALWRASEVLIEAAAALQPVVPAMPQTIGRLVRALAQ